MKNEFDFKKIGKKMPYTVPEKFFEEMEYDIRCRLSNKRHKPGYRKIVLGSVIASAASLAILLAIENTPKDNPGQPATFSQVEDAFASLAPEDQAYLIDLFQNEQSYYQQ